MNRILRSTGLVSVLACAAAASAERGSDATAVLGIEDRVAVVEGLAGPEAVHWDSDQQVWFISNFNGDAAGDANGFISRVAVDGELLEREFMTGSDEHPLHGPRGMRIDGARLWVADADGLHAFDRRSGEHVEFIDLSAHDPGFLNDVEIGPDGAIFLTDTGKPRLFRISGGVVSVVASERLPFPPNGVVWYPAADGVVLAPWDGGRRIVAWRPGSGDVIDVATLPAGGNLDGIEPHRDGLLIASQLDRSIWFWQDGDARVVIEVPGRPADIGLNASAGRIAVPYIALDRVDIWELPVDP